MNIIGEEHIIHSRVNRIRLWAQGYSIKELRNLQLKDADISKVLKWKETGTRPYGSVVAASSPETRHYWLYWSSLEVRDGLLMKRCYGAKESGNLQFIVPRSIREEIMKQMHNAVLSGHLGQRKTLKKLQQNFYWFENVQQTKNRIASPMHRREI